MAPNDQLMEVLSRQLDDIETGWSLGTFGAIAEFTRDPGEPVMLARSAESVSAVTARGGLRLLAHPDLRLVASETPTTVGWTQRVALCLPREACAMSQRTGLTEIGADHDALRAEDRSAILFDLGLSTLQVDVCVRSGDPDVVAVLRRHSGASLFDREIMQVMLKASPHRVFISRIGRAEIFQPIPPPDGRSPDGPHTHVLAKLLAHGLTHAATDPVPEGWVPCAHIFPPHPLRDQLGRPHPFQARHDTFQHLLARYGDPDLVALKRRIVELVQSGQEPTSAGLPSDRVARATIRVTLRQLQAAAVSAGHLSAWLAAHDRPGPDDAHAAAEMTH